MKKVGTFGTSENINNPALLSKTGLSSIIIFPEVLRFPHQIPQEHRQHKHQLMPDPHGTQQGQALADQIERFGGRHLSPPPCRPLASP